MDIYCPTCAEPWDIDELHEVEGMTFDQAYKQFQKKGCGVFGQKCASDLTPEQKEAAAKSDALMELLGDDVDGVAAMMQEELG